MDKALMEKKDVLFAVFLCSVSVLLFEMAQIRSFSYSMPSILSYIGISLAMTGFGIGAMLLSLVPNFGKLKTRTFLAVLIFLMIFSMIGSMAIFSRVSWDCLLQVHKGLIPLIFKIIFPCMLPYFFAGCFMAIVFSMASQGIGKVYFWNLFGSGVGAVLISVILTPLGAEGVIFAAAVIALVSVLFLTLPQNWKAASLAFIMLFVIAACYGYRSEILPFQPDPRDATGFYQLRASKEKGIGGAFENEYSEWNIVARIDVWNQKGKALSVPEETSYRLVTVDSGAATVIIGDPGEKKWGDELFEETMYGIAYHVQDRPENVLVIGTGGGTDVQTALHREAENVTAIEINSSTIDMISGPYADFTKWPLSSRVTLIHEDGRSFIKTTRDTYDVIQMSGVDTLTVNATGALNMVEEYLYTVEAFEDYLRVLKPGGVLCVIRFLAADLRLTAIAAEALLRVGIANPQNHIATCTQGLTTGIIVKKEPFTEEQLDSFCGVAERRTPNNVYIPPYEVFDFRLNAPIDLVYVPSRVVPDTYQEYFSDVASGPQGRKRQFDKLAVTTDDRPYFMFLGFLVAGMVTSIKSNFILFQQFWVATIIFAVACIILPVFLFKKKISGSRAFAWLLPYFSIIGVCFMMIEIGIINRFSIFIGSPGASIAVVLASILVASGVGSYVSGLLTWRPEKKILLSTIFLLVAAIVFIVNANHVFNFCWQAGFGQIARCVVAGALIIPIGFFMGWFFPSGLRVIDMYLPEPHFIPWAVSVNGFMSVVGSIIALPITFIYGFSYLFYISLAGYFLAGLLSYSLFKRT